MLCSLPRTSSRRRKTASSGATRETGPTPPSNGSLPISPRRAAIPNLPPPAPTNLRVTGNVLGWEAVADPESGIAAFIIERDGKRIATLPEKPANPFGRPLFQGLQYSDTPVQPLATMTFTDAQAAADTPHAYRVIAVNTVGLESR